MQNVDPLIQVALSVYTNKGAYALLIGSGVSRSAQILTGWEITLDLIKKLSFMDGKEINSDEELISWYYKKYKREPKYSDILNAIGKTPTERKNILRSYFEATKEESQKGEKIPKDAHKSIARLAAEGYIKIIITTNFDKLIEKALEEEGITPCVIYTKDHIKGMDPLPHQKSLVIKVNGDYLDSRIKNTEEELAKYDRDMKKLLDRIFSDYGLIICGWSAEWDTALRSSIERNNNSRYSIFWTIRREPNESVKNIITRKNAVTIKIESADLFFKEFTENLFVLDKQYVQHPLNTKVLVEKVKKYLAEDSYHIDFDVLVEKEARVIIEGNNDKDFPVNLGTVHNQEIIRRIEKYDNLTSNFKHLLIPICRWSKDIHHPIVKKSFEDIAKFTILGNTSGYVGKWIWIKLKYYPLFSSLYILGLSSVIYDKYDLLYQVLIKSQAQYSRHEYQLYYFLKPHLIVEDQSNLIVSNKPTIPLNYHTSNILRPFFNDLIYNDIDFEKAFYKTEYLFSLIYSYEEVNAGRPRSPLPGLYIYKNDLFDKEKIDLLDKDINLQSKNCQFLKAGFFDGDLNKFKEHKDKHDSHLINRYY